MMTHKGTEGYGGGMGALEVYILVHFMYLKTLCMQAARALVSLCICSVSSDFFSSFPPFSLAKQYNKNHTRGKIGFLVILTPLP